MSAMEARLHLVERAAQRLIAQAGIQERAGIWPAPPPPRSVPLQPGRDAAAQAADQSCPPLAREMLDAAGLVSVSESRSRGTEEFRLIQSELMRRIAEARTEAGRTAAGAPDLIMVTSARPDEGKSFAALNLAASIAVHNERPVTLVDGDAKPGGLSQALGLAKRPGLLDLAARSSRRPNDFVVPTAIPGLSFVPVGGSSGPERPAAQASAAAVAEPLQQHFPGQVVVLDAPPCLASTDPATMAAMVGHIVLVVAAGQTQSREVEAALALLHGCPDVMVLLNKVSVATGDSFGAYHS